MKFSGAVASCNLIAADIPNGIEWDIRHCFDYDASANCASTYNAVVVVVDAAKHGYTYIVFFVHELFTSNNSMFYGHFKCGMQFGHNIHCAVYLCTPFSYCGGSEFMTAPTAASTGAIKKQQQQQISDASLENSSADFYGICFSQLEQFVFKGMSRWSTWHDCGTCGWLGNTSKLANQCTNKYTTVMINHIIHSSRPRALPHTIDWNESITLSAKQKPNAIADA